MRGVEASTDIHHAVADHSHSHTHDLGHDHGTRVKLLFVTGRESCDMMHNILLCVDYIGHGT